MKILEIWFFGLWWTRAGGPPLIGLLDIRFGIRIRFGFSPNIQLPPTKATFSAKLLETFKKFRYFQAGADAWATNRADGPQAQFQLGKFRLRKSRRYLRAPSFAKLKTQKTQSFFYSPTWSFFTWPLITWPQPSADLQSKYLRSVSAGPSLSKFSKLPPLPLTGSPKETIVRPGVKYLSHPCLHPFLSNAYLTYTCFFVVQN